MLLVNPTGERYGGTLSPLVPLSLPYPVGCLAAQLRAGGYKFRVVDEEVEKLDWQNVERYVEGLPEPHVFGITCLTAQAHRTCELCGMLKAKYPNSTIIMGGYHATALPEEALALGNVDVVVMGEGERTLIQLYEKILSGDKDYSDIPGVAWKPDGSRGRLRLLSDGDIVKNPEAPLIKDIDSLPMFPFDLFANPRYDYGFIMTSRGCPYKCTYCNMRMMTGNTYRFNSCEKVIAELDIMINRFGAKQIFFMDDNFCFKKSRVKELADAICRAGLHRKCKFGLQTRADNFYPDVVPMLKEAGFTAVGFGLETGIDELLLQIHKGETVEQHREAVALAKRYGMDVALYMIFGLPGENAEDRRRSYEVVKSMGPTFIKFNNLIPYPGTPMYSDAAAGGRMVKEGHWENFLSNLAEMGSSLFSHRSLPYVPEAASEWELKRDMVRYNVRAQLRADVIKGFLQGKQGPGWLKLERGWYKSPRQWLTLCRILLPVFFNFALCSLPLRWTEPIVERLNPKLQRRVPEHERKGYLPSEWGKDAAKKQLA